MPAVIVTGPRQAGKTTLARSTWPDKPYVNLERPDLRRFAIEDPRAFLAAYPDGAILDEIQRAPELRSWLQVRIDESPVPGRWILTGSEQLSLTGRTSQSLAGRAAFAHLLPLDAAELADAGHLPPSDDGPAWAAAALRGGYPAPFSLPVDLHTWLDSYVEAYVERDVRSLLAVGDLGRFQTFLALAAGRTGQLLNLSSLGADASISHPTVSSWLSVLEATFVALRLPPWHANLGKRLIKSAKVYFWDSGLLCHLLRLRTAAQLAQHPLRGAVFEAWVVAEILKREHHAGRRPEAFFYRDQSGLEVDLLVRRADRWLAVEIKSGATVASDWFDGLRAFAVRTGGTLDGLPIDPVLIYGGDDEQRRTDGRVIPWHGVAQL
jgi:uncharacterized protein